MKINEKTWTFIKKHADEDVRKVALLGTKDPEVDLKMALQQSDGRQTAHKKLPTWAEVEGIIYPPHLNMEQCSSEQTARYKARIAGKGESLVDLTGGFGVDFYWMSQDFSQCTYVEQNEQLWKHRPVAEQVAQRSVPEIYIERARPCRSREAQIFIWYHCNDA